MIKTPEQIKFTNFSSEPAEVLASIEHAVNNVIHSNQHILGKNVETFEKRWAKYLGVEGSVGVGNGLDAIEICLKCLDIGKGDEVITTPLTAFATTLAILKVGAIPVYADIDLDTGLINIESVKRCYSKKTKALLVVHLYGLLENIDHWRSWCDTKEIHLVEDCAQSHGARYNGKMAGSFGDCSAFSFYPTKNLGAIGDGGCIASNNIEILNHANILRNYGQEKNYEIIQLGLNSRLDEIQASILNVKLDYLNDNIKKRQKNARTYFEQINNSQITMLRRPEKVEQHAYHLFVLRTSRREKLLKYLLEKKIQSIIHYPILCNEQKVLMNFRTDPLGIKNANIFSETCISIPVSHNLSESEQSIIVDAINKFKGI
jgi:dTDP-4-amino-4,6-dideoxygalactose transaminase